MENCIGRMDVINTKNGKTIMTKEKAKLIADSFLDNMNPDLWNGEGNKPKSFNDMGLSNIRYRQSGSHIWL